MATPLESPDLRSVQEARTLAAKAREAQKALAAFSQEQVDHIFRAAALAAADARIPLAQLAFEETGIVPALLFIAQDREFQMRHAVADVRG